MESAIRSKDMIFLISYPNVFSNAELIIWGKEGIGEVRQYIRKMAG
jgi:hypothetical protein